MDGQASGAQRVVEVLRRRGVRTIFTLSGNQVLPLYDALFDAETRLLSTRHEAAAVHMADAWGQLTSTAGVALVTAGPGHSNALTALGVARGNESPVVLFSGAAETTTRGTGAFQDLLQAEMATFVAKWATSADDPGAAGVLVEHAFSLAEAPIPGPVSVSLPYDTQVTRVMDRRVDPASAAVAASIGPGRSGEEDWTELIGAVGEARAPLLLGSPWVARTEEFLAAGAHLGCPAFALESARAGSDPLLFGSEAAFRRADLVVLLAPWDYTSRTEAILGKHSATILQVWPGVPSGAVSHGGRSLSGQPRNALRAILGVPAREDQSRRRAVARAQDDARTSIVRASYETRFKGVHPLHLAEAVRRRLREGDVVSIDGGEFCQWVRLGLAWGPWRTVINGKFGPIGTAVSHALGARVAVGEAPAVLGFAGDGGFGYHALEIETAARERLPAILFVGTDGKWGAEWHLQRRRYGEERVIGSELSVCLYEELAKGLGGVGLLLEHDEQIETTLDTAWRAMRDGRIVLVNVMAAPLPSPAALH